MHLDYDENGKYSKNRVPLVDLKRVMTEWQDKMYENDGWNSLYWSNHDQARAVSRFGNDSEKYRVISAKMLGTCLHMMQRQKEAGCSMRSRQTEVPSMN